MCEQFEKLGLFYLGRSRPSRRLARRPMCRSVSMNHSGDARRDYRHDRERQDWPGYRAARGSRHGRHPGIAIDPKGDLGNLLLTFPELSAAAFQPWVMAEDARGKGVSESDLAAAEAARWTSGLADWGQSGERIARLRAATDFAIYTPGSTAAVPLSILKSFAPRRRLCSTMRNCSENV